MRVFVLLFNAGTENEGIHTIRIGDRDKVLMFESEDDANRFALMLEAQDFPSPTVEEIDSEEIDEFCASSGYESELVPANGSLVLPPEVNVEKTDWEADKPEESSTKTEESADNESPQAGEMSEAELDKIRRKLEGLL
ncbi:DUF3110 domain-containing protein [Mastigocoleus sp. MO_188.B34]|uniref:DUF3110 domain-containing protein n=1 Tax=Mastigocoleus sp. MO_188.B34 TaxID=3036635 RepID=UPI00260A7AFA|nr:DUF3110 domain-containing protein [Mastigocoleus sp. MO_188.B34]MDJ0696327.1 DUF3110 domain-containing protein [Mastigocoleus sp. MO_188.B34]